MGSPPDDGLPGEWELADIDPLAICPLPAISYQGIGNDGRAIDKEVMHGAPCFANTRVPVQTLIDFPETGETIDDFLAVYPAILRQDVFSFLELSRDIAIDQLECASL